MYVCVSVCIYVCIYIYVGSIVGPHFNLCRVNKWSTFSFDVLFCVSCPLLSAGSMRFLENQAKKTKI